MFNLNEQAALGLSRHHLVEFDGSLVEQGVVEDLARLINAAKKEGLDIGLASTFRDFERQSLIWNNKFNGLRPVFDHCDKEVSLATLSDLEKCHKILLFSAMPGASRHHFGTELDIFDRAAVDKNYKLQLSPSEYSQDGPFYQLAIWLKAHAQQYGFFLPYQSFRGGVAAEPWHISHIGRSAFYQSMHTKELLTKQLLHSEVLGWQALTDNLDQLYTQYIDNITPADNR
jgi:LAS superfamily LD-carboxypeptidase LdcB